MREILYLQFGNYSNYVGTHFWNMQDEYRSVDMNEEDDVDSTISFAERYNPNGSYTLYPRVVIFDQKENFGTLAQSNALHATSEIQSSPGLWDHPVDEIRQDQITKSTYHVQMDEEDPSDPSHMAGATNIRNIRYWSDYSHVYYLPRSIQRVPNVLHWENPGEDWKQSQIQFHRYNEDNDLMDTSIRLFLEESDNIQGIQLMNDVSTFGGFSSALLTQVNDEFMKTPVLALPMLLTGVMNQRDIDNKRSVRQILNEAFHLRCLKELASICLPIRSPLQWPEHAWMLPDATRSSYYSSSIISAHVENVTFPLRTRSAHDSIDAFGVHLTKAEGLSSFAEISGVIPVLDSTNFGHSLVNFTTLAPGGVPYSIRDVIRGFDHSDRQKYDQWLVNSVSGIKLKTIQASGQPSIESLRPNAADLVKSYSRVSTSFNLARMFKDYASFLEFSLRRRTVGIMSVDIDIDEIRELVSDLWAIHDQYPVDDENADLGDVNVDDE